MARYTATGPGFSLRSMRSRTMTHAALISWPGASATAADAQAAKATMLRLQEVTVAHFEHEESEVEPMSDAHRDAPEIHEMARSSAGASLPSRQAASSPG